MADKKTNLKDAIMDLARSLESVFRKYTKSTREKAWDRITGKEGQREVQKIIVDPNRQLSIFGKLATQKESFETRGPKIVWLDDERPMPEGFDLHVKTASEAIALIRAGMVYHISLDHDLGHDSNGTGYDVAKFIEEGAFQGSIAPMEVSVHSANPVGANNMKRCIDNAKKFWGLS
jgi:hypothetical protein